MQTMLSSIMKSMPWHKTPPPMPAAPEEPAIGDLDDPAALDAIIAANRATINKCWDELDRLNLVLQTLNSREARLNARNEHGSKNPKLHNRPNVSRTAQLSSSDHKGGSTTGAKGA